MSLPARRSEAPLPWTLHMSVVRPPLALIPKGGFAESRALSGELLLARPDDGVRAYVVRYVGE